jgi:hypothetical protein
MLRGTFVILVFFVFQNIAITPTDRPKSGLPKKPYRPSDGTVDGSGSGGSLVVSPGSDILVIEEHSLAGGLEIVELAAPRRPDKGSNTGSGEQEGEGQSDVDDGHRSIMNYEL